MGFTSKKVAATGLIMAAVALQAWKYLTRKSGRRSQTKYITEDRASENHDVRRSRELAQVKVAVGGSGSDLDGASNLSRERVVDEEEPRHWLASSKRFAGALLIVCSLLLSGVAVWLSLLHHWLEGGLSLLAALALSAFLMRGPNLHNKLLVTLGASALLVLQLVAVIVSTIIGVHSTHGPVMLLEITAFGVIGIAIAVSCAVTWRPELPFAESLAIGLVGVWLGYLCLSALPTFTGSLGYPIVDGQALLFATGTENQKLFLNVSVDPESNQEFFTIAGTVGIHWALMLTGDARISKIFTVPVNTKSVKQQEFSEQVNTLRQDVELFSGQFSPDSFEISINGTSGAHFANKTSDRSAVSTPEYGQGDLRDMGPIGRRIVDSLGRTPSYRTSGDFTTVVESNHLGPFETVTQAIPSLDPNLNPTQLQWTGGDLPFGVSYATVDQNAVDSTNNALFVFAILLGVAGACVVASIQGVIHRLLSRERSVSSVDGDKG